MNSALFARTNGVFQYVYDGATDWSALTGTLATYSASGILVANASSTVPAQFICLDGQGPTGGPSTFGVIGGALGPCRVIAHGVIGQYQRVIQDATGGVIADTGEGNSRVVVGVALEASAANGSYIIVDFIAPVEYTAD
jgi:hypothetical protein